MPQKDYVKRGRSPKQAKPAEKPTFPWVNVTVAVVIIIGFVAVLWQIKDNAPDAPDVVVNEPEIIAETDEDDLPELPQEEWEFIKTLPGYEVEVEQVEQYSSGKRYLMQCGSFRREAQAEEMRAKIALTGLESLVRLSDGSNGRWYRVILGPFDTKRDAERARHSVRRTGIVTCQIWFWNL